MIETGSLPCGWTRRNFLKACGAAGALMLFPWLAYASEADDLEAKADELDAQAEAAQAQMDELSAKLDALEQQFNEALARYNEANDAHEAALAAMDDAQERIDAAKVRIAETQDQLSNRAVNMYREGNPTMLDVLFGSQSFDAFVTNLDAMHKIGEQDAALVQESKDAKAEADAAYEEYSKQEKLAAEELENARIAKEELEAAQASLQEEYNSMSDEVAAIRAEAEQTRMSAEEARQKEEEAKRAAQEALAAAQSSSSGSSGSSGGSSSGGSTSNTPSTSVDGWVNPAPGTYITSGFGWRPSIGDYHQGVDLSCSYEPVYCMADGTVTTSGWFGTGGMAVTVDHGGGIVSWYLHNSQLLVSVGQQVSAGQQISVSGNTGFSTGAHLHFQINVGCSNGINGTAVNPTTYFSW
ncbi:peptidase M23 [Slackia equolifaciens]|uniref:Peptidase M23 n=1 Tax=Slackia equolifaciens TaxID=498718 RepID=A0A3N0AUF9_9ACTN|nr:peptidoglycan DD-metalloendopeptidase family protein [Slackia equolifaciens]RNL38542.1 peptidase M23 [Slackia equolifaciens]